ncbi:enolase C-terminal domain-like protein [Georgenia thermotolerans]|uniref:Mandelate racemase n=1 Tax=Georgenia thermotolerans TaxID=527326 RepID=A0A7J5UQY3_9MICO|nr:enolase C-terminal domain-like protein [Georgenia thermotolerans]KAE8764836.1 mandelate racemase [Georgenia thermotolerans]
MRPDAPVEGLDVSVYTVPTDQPEADGTIAWSATTMVAVRARAGGAVGLGWTYAAAAAAQVVRDVLADVVRGRDARDVPAAWAAMQKQLRNVGRPGIASCALSAVDVALWDLAARLLDVPLVRLLGRARDTVPVYGSGGFTTYDDATLRSQLGGWVHEDGIPRVKIKIGESWGTRTDRDLARARLARATIGDGAELFVDANGAYSVGQAVRLARPLEDQGVTWFEEPVSSDDLAGLRHVRGRTTADVAAGEYAWSLVEAQRLCAAQAVDCLQADATRCGGYTEWLRIAAVAAAHHLEVSAHCAPALHAPVAAAAANLRHVEWFHDHVRIEHLLLDGAPDATGGAMVPDLTVPGHGITLAPAAEQYRTG